MARPKGTVRLGSGSDGCSARPTSLLETMNTKRSQVAAEDAELPRVVIATRRGRRARGNPGTMSQWATLSATFITHSPGTSLATRIRLELERRDRLAPTGSEEGPEVRTYDTDPCKVVVTGRLRDMTDFPDSHVVLAWFVLTATHCRSATLLWDIDYGPRYRYELPENGKLTRLQGVLD